MDYTFSMRPITPDTSRRQIAIGETQVLFGAPRADPPYNPGQNIFLSHVTFIHAYDIQS